MTRFISLSSGSSGNCYYIGNEQVSLLIDVGLSSRMIKKRLSEFGISLESISFVLVTHDHIDHIKYLGTFAQKFKTPVIATKSYMIHSLFTHAPEDVWMIAENMSKRAIVMSIQE
jgi:Metal-dependent hydrolases of the beta-lactamase superfamily I